MKIAIPSVLIFSLFLICGNVKAQKTLPKATVTICENTDDNVNAINPKAVIKVGEPVVFLVSFDEKYKIKDETESEQFFIGWEVYKLDDNGNDEQNISELQMRVESLYRRYATVEFQTFPKPGKYRVYALPWEMRDINYKGGNYEKYWGKMEIEVIE